jgi:hypothetical protein
MAEKTFIDARQEQYREAHNSLDPERFIDLFADDVDYSDHGIHSQFFQLRSGWLTKKQVLELQVSTRRL